MIEMKLFHRFKLNTVSLRSLRLHSNVCFDISRGERHTKSSVNKSLHCYKTLYPWDSAHEFSNYLLTCVEYNKDGLLVLNKPFGIKIHGHDKPGARPKSDLQFIKPSVPQCDYTIEDALPVLQEHFNLPNLSIVKSAEKYTSGVVLLSSSDKVTKKLQKSFNLAKHHKKPHLVHWAVTLGYPVVPYRKEKVGIKFVEKGINGKQQPVLDTEITKAARKKKKVYPVNVESRVISVNTELSTSLVEIASSSVRYHFLRVYASSRVAPILGDILYGSRMKTLFGVPVKTQLSDSSESGFEPFPRKMSEILYLPTGTSGQLMIPTMLHLRSIVLPDYCQKDKDFTVTVKLPTHFQWTVERLNLLHSCK